MARVTSKLQVTIPKAVADAHGIEPGTDLEFESAGDVIRVSPRDRRTSDARSLPMRIAMFDRATQRQQERDARWHTEHSELEELERGWRREDLYDRGLPR